MFANETELVDDVSEPVCRAALYLRRILNRYPKYRTPTKIIHTNPMDRPTIDATVKASKEKNKSIHWTKE